MSIGFYTIPANKIIHYTHVDLSSRHCIGDTIHAVQYDNNIPILAVKLRNNGASYIIDASSMEAWIRWKKPDGTFVRKQALGCDTAQNTLYFEITQQMVMYNGTVKPVVELVIPASNGEPSVACTSSFSVIVDKNPIQNGDIESTSVYEDPYKNVVYTKKEVDKLLNLKLDKMPFDTTPKVNSPNYITSGTVYDSISKKADKASTLAGYGITDAYDKAYFNKALSFKLDKMPFDTTPKVNSPNYITSGTVYNAMQSKADKTSFEQGKGNLSCIDDAAKSVIKSASFNYVKNNNAVTITFNVVFNAGTIPQSGFVRFSGLPFKTLNAEQLLYKVVDNKNKEYYCKLYGTWLSFTVASGASVVADETISFSATYII